MTNHIDEDLLLKYKLELLEVNDAKRIENHISECKTCLEKSIEVKNQPNVIGGIKLNEENEFYLLDGKKSITTEWIKRAAIILIGFFLGYLTSQLIRPNHVVVVEQNLIPQPQKTVLENFSACSDENIWRGSKNF